MNTKITIALLLLLVANISAQRVSINAETRQALDAPSSSGDQFVWDLQDQFNNAASGTQGYCVIGTPTFPLSNQSACGGSKRNIIWQYIIEFYVPFRSNFSFQYGTDFGRGMGVILNDQVVLSTNANLWWQENWDHQSVQRFDSQLNAGQYTMVIYGNENGSDGPTNMRFSFNGEDWQTLSVESLTAVAQAQLPHDGSPFSQSIEETKVIIESRFGDAESFGAGQEFVQNLVINFETAQAGGEGYCVVEDPTYPFENSVTCGADSNIYWRFIYNFFVAEQARYVFQFGLDFGKGGAGFIDGQLAFFETTDIWWEQSWDSAKVEQIAGTLPIGYHQIVIYGAEGTNEGQQSARFAVNGGSWQDATESNLEIAGTIQTVETDDDDDNGLPDSNLDDHQEGNHESVEDAIQVLYEARQVSGAPPSGESDEDFVLDFIELFDGATESENSFCQVPSDFEYPIGTNAQCSWTGSQIWRLEVSFYAWEDCTWSFQLGASFSNGLVFIVDDDVYNIERNAVAFSGNWDDEGVQLWSNQVSRGFHTLVVYAAESNDAEFVFRFKHSAGDGCDWLWVTEDNLAQIIPSHMRGYDLNICSNHAGNFVEVETRFGDQDIEGTGSDFADNLRLAFNQANHYQEGYCTVYGDILFPFCAAEQCGAGENVLTRLIIKFNAPEEAEWRFRFGADFSRGAVVYIDSEPELIVDHGVAWAGEWESSDVFSVERVFTKGEHVIRIYGANGQEGNGTVSAQFNYLDKGWFNVGQTILDGIESPAQCTVLYDECDYQGEKLEVCDDIAVYGPPGFKPRSVFVPRGITATVYDLHYWRGEYASFTESIDCMHFHYADYQEQADSNLLQQKHNIKVSKHKNKKNKNLRKQHKKNKKHHH